MYWEEDSKDEKQAVPDSIVDLVFSIGCRSLPVDHAYALSREVEKLLPWWSQEQGVGLHTIHVAESGNGWMRPENADALLHPSRRTKLKLRVPRHRIADASAIVGRSLDVAGHEVSIKDVKQRPLSDHPTVFARYVVIEENQQELDLVSGMVQQMKAMGVQPKKVLCGTSTKLAAAQGELITCSLMVADLSVEDSLRLQMEGLGSHRTMGCGVFIPHKDIKEVG